MRIKNLSSEELMKIYQLKSPELAYEAFEELYRRFSQKVFSYLLNKLHNRADAEDILQKVFIKVHKCKHLYSDKYKFEQWIFVISRSLVTDHYRAMTRELNNKKKIEIHELEECNFPELYLNKNEKELLELKYIDELSYKELSSIFNKSETSLRKMVSRITANIRRREL
jgi:RNA polymerase sigma-70 factor (ECF subfamily)